MIKSIGQLLVEIEVASPPWSCWTGHNLSQSAFALQVAVYGRNSWVIREVVTFLCRFVRKEVKFSPSFFTTSYVILGYTVKLFLGESQSHRRVLVLVASHVRGWFVHWDNLSVH